MKLGSLQASRAPAASFGAGEGAASPDAAAHGSARSSKDLLIVSRQFASEFRWLSWWHLWSSLFLFGALTTVAVLDIFAWWRVLASILAGLLLVRLFILFHDFQHGAILHGSPIARVIMLIYGLATLNPPSVWNRSHGHHHQNNAKGFDSNIGSFPVMTTEDYAAASRSERFLYAVSRHPLTMAAGYLTVFLYGMCARPLLLCPKRHLDAGFAILLHAGIGIALAVWEFDNLLLAMIVPMCIASAFGAYLFYAQHNFPAVKLRTRKEWTYVEAALSSSSFIRMSWLMHWFTGNIGYHHVHHLNARIPFYRLPEAMAVIPELQTPGTTSLRPHDVAACLRLKLWDPKKDRLVTFAGD